jgi:hypothetical protein
MFACLEDHYINMDLADCYPGNLFRAKTVSICFSSTFIWAIEIGLIFRKKFIARIRHSRLSTPKFFPLQG